MTTSRIDADSLHEALEHAERDLGAVEEGIKKQQRFVERLEARGESTTIEIARALLTIMEAARSQYLGDRDRITRLLAKHQRCRKSASGRRGRRWG